jgi:hypothetical protein
MSHSTPSDDESTEQHVRALLHARAATVAPSPEVIRGRVDTARWSVAHRRPLGLWLSSVAALLVVVLVGAILLTVRPSAPGTGPGATPTPTRAGVTATPGLTQGPHFPDGIPSALDGLPVLRLADARTHIAAATDATSFLIGGWERPAPPLACFATDLSTFSLSICGRPSLADTASDLESATPPPLLLTELPRSVQLEPYGPLVLRVHVQDPAAAKCDPSVRRQCEVAVVVEAVMWSQDIPASIGAAPVTSVYDALGHGAAASGAAPMDGGSFLVGGWFQRETPDFCPLVPVAVTPLLACGNPALLASPEADASGLPLAFLETSVNLPTMGRVVLRGHVDDPSAAACPEAERVSCQRVFVVEAVVWQGLPYGWI